MILSWKYPLYNFFMKNFFLFLADFIYRKRCFICSDSRENKHLCSKCFETIEFLPLCVERVVAGKKVYCVCEYEDVVKQIIRNIKYHNQKDLAYYEAKILFAYWEKVRQDDKKYMVVPVPLSKERLKKRKYNQVEVVAREFCKMTGYELNTELVERIRNTKPQYDLTRKQRLENLKDAFLVHTENYNNEPILLLDDVCTTGATFESIVKEFEKHNISDITCMAAATPVK